jgi:tripartite-type tricarboxylate transporter receptor subunit TctC
MTPPIVRRSMVLLLALTPWLAGAQGAWPSRPVKVVVPFAAGAATDIVARAVMERVSKQIGQPVIIENRPGAGGTIGAGLVATAEADGYTWLIHSNSMTVSAASYKSLSFDPQKDFIGITPLASVPMVMVTSPERGIKTLQDFVKYAKANPTKINYASAGSGGVTHLGAERVRIAGGFQATHIPTKGTNEALTEVMSGRVDFYFSPIGLATPLIQSGKLLPLAVSSAKRFPTLPAVPTLLEGGLPNSEYEVWIAMFGPAKLPKAVVDRMHEEVLKALASPELRERYRGLMMDDMSMNVDQFNRFLASDFRLNAELIKAAGVQPN